VDQRGRAIAGAENYQLAIFAAKVPPHCRTMGTKLPETHGLSDAGPLRWWDMGRFSNFVRLGSKLVLEIMPSVAATVIGGYLLAQLHFARTAEPQPQPQPQAQQATVAPKPTAPQTPTVREDRAAMREVLKERRENPETPAMVRPIVTAAPVSAPASAPASPPAPVIAQLPAAMDSIAPNEAIERAAAPSRTNVTAAPIALPRARPDTTASVYVPAPPPGLPQAPATAMDAPMQVAPAVVGTAEPQLAPPAPPAPQVAPEPPVQRGPVGAVFSTLSSFVGTAATATGHTVNWVIDLPGKAIEAGGRVIGVNPPPPPNRPFS
jgi:hypothetical protein